MEINLKGKTALVTGGNAGIGRAIALALAECGAAVAVTRYQHESATAAEITAKGGTAFEFRLDASDSGQVAEVVRDAAAALGGHIDILINNAGDMLGRVPLAQMSDEHWRRVIDVNLSSCFYGTRDVAPCMDRGWGRIVNLSSLAGHDGGGQGAAAYAAAKAGVIALTRGAAKEFAGRGITVNAVAPGFIPGTRFHTTYTSEEAQRATVARIPLGRGGSAEDVAGAVLWLASDLASFITGEVIEINGGAYFG